AMKAGAMEAADILVLNKADLAERDKALSALEEALALGPRESGGWQVRVLAASATKNEGVLELAQAADEHQAWLKASPEGARRLKDQLRTELSLLVSRRLAKETLSTISEAHLEDLAHHRTDPFTLGAGLAARQGRGRGTVDHVTRPMKACFERSASSVRRSRSSSPRAPRARWAASSSSGGRASTTSVSARRISPATCGG
ncbi:MAG: hypothetical protein NTX64_06665, partial [Elusimicrobia bacterium]|nr:hypothetical protein [Elusimicrobiota bacterium]